RRPRQRPRRAGLHDGQARAGPAAHELHAERGAPRAHGRPPRGPRPEPWALHEISPTYVRDRLSRIAGTPYESLLVTPEDAMVFGAADPTSVMVGGVSIDEHLLEELSPARGLLDKKWQAREHFIHKIGKH